MLLSYSYSKILYHDGYMCTSHFGRAAIFEPYSAYSSKGAKIIQ
jgi:hypothetical protein